MPSEPAARTLILVDGTCVFCNRLVAFILRRDRKAAFLFAHLQGDAAATVLRRHGLAPDIDTIYAIADYELTTERVLVDGAAGRFIWPQLFWFGHAFRFVPLWLLDAYYRAFARVRYRLFGQADACIVPSAEQRARFLD